MSPSPAGRAEQIPQLAAAIVDLVNSRPHAHYPDGLDEQAGALALLRQFDPALEAVTPEQLDEVRALRALLTGLLATNVPARAGGEVEEAEREARRLWAELAELVAPIALQLGFSVAGPALRPLGAATPAASVAVLVGDLTCHGDWSRLRICANHECGAAFYDTSRSRTQRWHSYELCGNRANVAAYRRRARASA